MNNSHEPNRAAVHRNTIRPRAGALLVAVRQPKPCPRRRAAELGGAPSPPGAFAAETLGS
jgi:hypothetical protein